MKVLLVTVVSLCVQLGIAILGMGGSTAFFSHTPLVAVTVAMFLMGVVASFSSGNLSPGEREDRQNRWVFGALGVLSILLAYIPAYTDRYNLWTLDGEVTRWIGFVLFVIGGVLRIWPVFVLGYRFSGLVAIQRDHQLVTTGIYRYVRNPSYLGLIVASLGWALAFRSAPGVLIVALLLIPLVARMRSEERLLTQHFGAEYETYRQRTWRLLPGIY